MPTLTKTWTEEELLALPKDDGKYELVDGELERMPPARPEHGKTTISLGSEVCIFVKKHKLGYCYDGQTGFWMKSGNLRSPDISFIPTARAKTLERDSQAFYKGAPDLAIEVLSPTERPKATAGKLKDYFESGTRLAWVVNNPTRTVRVHRDAQNFTLLRIGDTSDGEDVLPGFKLPLAELFAD
jgi:Uma2 family endonuclease